MCGLDLGLWLVCGWAACDCRGVYVLRCFVARCLLLTDVGLAWFDCLGGVCVYGPSFAFRVWISV